MSAAVAMAAIILPIVLSCGGVERRTPGMIPPSPQAEAREPSDSAADLAGIYMQAGDYQKAIDVFHAAHQKAPQDQALVDAYFDSLAYMAASADRDFGRQAVADAGRTYDVLLRNYPRFQSFESRLGFTRAHLDGRLDDCKKTLYKQGFQAYRKGRLAQAIAHWEDYLALDPGNPGIKEALRTAKLQQKNLREAE